MNRKGKFCGVNLIVMKRLLFDFIYLDSFLDTLQNNRASVICHRQVCNSAWLCVLVKKQGKEGILGPVRKTSKRMKRWTYTRIGELLNDQKPTQYMHPCVAEQANMSLIYGTEASLLIRNIKMYKIKKKFLGLVMNMPWFKFSL